MSYASWSVIAGETPTATKWNTLGSNDADFDSRITQLVDDKTIDEEADGSTITFDLSERRAWYSQVAGNRTLVFDNVGGPKPFMIAIQQDGTGGRIPVWPDGIDWPGGFVPPFSTGANLTDVFVFIPKPDWVESSNEVYWGLVAGVGLEEPA